MMNLFTKKQLLHEGCTVQPKTKDELLAIIEDAIETYGSEVDLNFIDTSKITDMSHLFQDSFFNGNINEWDTSNVTDMSSMFYGAKNFNQPLDKWNVSNVLYMSEMFKGAENFNQPLNNWDIHKVISAHSMFQEALHFNQDLNNWLFNHNCDVGNFLLGASRFKSKLPKNLVIKITFEYFLHDN